MNKTFKLCAVSSIAAAAAFGCATPSTRLQNASGQVVTCSAQGYGVLGATSAMMLQQDCVNRMEADGYRQIDAANVAPAAVKKADSTISVALPAGWIEKPLNAAQAAGGGQVHAINATIDAGLLVSQASKAGITDFAAYSSSRRAATASRLKGATWSEVRNEAINGRRAWTFWVKGESNGIALHSENTVIEGSETVVLVSRWTSIANFDGHREHLQSLPALVAGY